MHTKTALTVEEYLRTSFPDLDKEYRDGDVEERSMPDYLHSKTQGLLIAFLLALRGTLKLFVCPELRMKLGTGRYLIPDVAVFYPDEPAVQVPDTPPLIAIEILSEDDRMNALREKLQDVDRSRDGHRSEACRYLRVVLCAGLLQSRFCSYPWSASGTEKVCPTH